MRRLLALLMLCAAPCLATPATLRIAVSESWSMPLMQLRDDRPVDGILFEVFQTLARRAGVEPEYHLMPRLRLQQAMREGDIDVQCYVAPAWLDPIPPGYRWSVPLLVQRDVLVAAPGVAASTTLAQLHRETVGAVLGFRYPALDTAWQSGELRREDSRNQLLALQKLEAGRFRFAVSNQLTLDWYNRQLPPDERLQALEVLEEDALGCLVRDDPRLPVRALLAELKRMKRSGDIDQVVRRYLARTATAPSD
ncbi:amino acid ABC transporter substrate-binding protein [Pseudomonas entomophila]|uniref:substrate-binding periplasmic protein n=1 Tax=Pseudomonas entomophila TaxID=312306 RepID=UPI0015E27ED2|nr:transporter substrate-binding domain-containing protein [Pseudomonas entomophila]MBA1187914.1 amino acid ABC transporter substrate-binding protein [Pseudomonas entomophila]